jgi:ankyrin repeat protein
MLLKDKRVDPTAKDNEAIYKATLRGHERVLDLLLSDHRINISEKNYIGIASEYGRFQVVAMLLRDKRIDPSVQDNYAIRFASANGHKDVVELLLRDKRVDPTAYNNFAIHQAKKNGHPETVSVLRKYIYGR